MQPASLSNPFYYLRNAEQVVTWCLQTYTDLLTQVDIERLQAWQKLDDQPKALLIRLVMRKGQLFRRDKLNYDEIPRLESALGILSEVGLVVLNPSVSAAQLANGLRRHELWQWLSATQPDVALSKQTKKSELLDLVAPSVAEKPLSEWWPKAQIKLIELTCNDLFERLRLLFFGNLHQDWSEFVLSGLGVQRYEKVVILADQRAFQATAEVEFYSLLHRLAQRLEAGESAALIAEDVPADVEVTWLQEKLQKLLFALGHNAEREGHIDLALSLYLRSATHDAKVRRLRVLEKHAPVDVTWQQSQVYLQDTQQPVVRLLLQRVASRCANKRGIAFAIDRPLKPLEAHLALAFDASVDIEQAVVNHYRQASMVGFHVENELFTGLFGLLFWPAIYAPVPGAFFHPFQARPKDLYSPHFCRQRQQLIDEAMASLGDGRYQQLILQRWHEKRGISCRFMNWNLLSEELITLALACIPAAHLQAIFAHMLQDLRHHCSGMPDLVVFDKQAQSYELIEVKGPGDRLQEHQTFWLDFYQRNNIPAKVVYVAWQA